MHRPGIEPGPPAWQASILPLNHRCFMMVCGSLQTEHNRNFNPQCTLALAVLLGYTDASFVTSPWGQGPQIRDFFFFHICFASFCASLWVTFDSRFLFFFLFFPWLSILSLTGAKHLIRRFYQICIRKYPRRIRRGIHVLEINNTNTPYLCSEIQFYLAEFW